jgi:ribosomal protein L30E
MVDVEKAFKNMVKKGTVIFGNRQTRLTIEDGKAKLVVFSNNCPFVEELTSISEKHDVPVYQSDVDSVELGSICGKMYAVSTFAVVDDGGVNISQLLKQR